MLEAELESHAHRWEKYNTIICEHAHLVATKTSASRHSMSHAVSHRNNQTRMKVFFVNISNHCEQTKSWDKIDYQEE